MQEIILTNSSQLQNYFEQILKLRDSGEKYPVSIDMVWELVYERRDNATKALKESFIESIDYELRQNAKVVSINEIVNGIKVECWLSTECLEYFIARKNRDVFEVYRRVFHKAIREAKKELTKKELAQMVIDSENARELAEAKVLELAPKAEVYEQIVNADNLLTLNDAAKALGIGRNKLFEFLRKEKILFETNTPYQCYITEGYFKVKVHPIKKGNVVDNYTQTFVTGKGLAWLTKRLNKR